MADNYSALCIQDNVISAKELNILIVAGEVSGDQHGAELIRALKPKLPEIQFYGIGGDEMIKEGLRAAVHIRDVAFMGFAEVIKHIPYMMGIRKRLMNLSDEKCIRFHIYIDYPGFNLSLAKKSKEAGRKNIYYIAPQIWAWGQKRAFKIRRIIDKLLVINPFEVDFYKKYGVEAVYTGHPLVHKMAEYKYKSREELNGLLGLDPGKDILVIMPGSRKQEISKIFIPAAEGAKMLCEKFNLQGVVLAAPSVNSGLLEEIAKKNKLIVTDKYNYDLMKEARFGVIKSGTSTLEAAISGLPHTVVYSTTALTYNISRMLIKIDKIALANIINGKIVVPELIQERCTPEMIFEEGSKILSSPELYANTVNELKNVKNILGNNNSAEVAADEILSFIRNNEKD